MPAARLVAHEDVLDAGVVERVIGRQVRAARVPEYDLDALGLEAVHDGVDSAHWRSSAPSGSWDVTRSINTTLQVPTRAGILDGAPRGTHPPDAQDRPDRRRHGPDLRLRGRRPADRERRADRGSAHGAHPARQARGR